MANVSERVAARRCPGTVQPESGGREPRPALPRGPRPVLSHALGTEHFDDGRLQSMDANLSETVRIAPADRSVLADHRLMKTPRFS